MGKSIIKKIFGLFSGNKTEDTSRNAEITKHDSAKDDSAKPDVVKPDIETPSRRVDIYDSIMMAEVKPSAEEEINSTVSGILSVIKDYEDDPELDMEEKELRGKITSICHEILAQQNQTEKIEKIRQLLSTSSGLTAISIFTIRLRQTTDL